MSQRGELPAILGGQPLRSQSRANAVPRPEIAAALQACFASGAWSQYRGPETAALQRELAEFHGVEHAQLCSSGTAAVELALRGLGVGAGDEIILAGYDFKGNFLNVTAIGAVPVLVDIDPQTGQLDLERVKQALTSKTRAIIASHLHGGMVDLGRLRALVETARVAIIEDACQMPGARGQGGRVGSQGNVGVISFGGSKLLSAGRGGALLTNRSDMLPRIRRYAFRGNDAYPLSELQAAVVRPQLRSLDHDRCERRRAVDQLRAALADVPGLAFAWAEPPECEPDYYKVALRYDAQAWGRLSRERFAATLQAEGLPIAPGFRSLDAIHARSRFRQAGDLGECHRADREWLVLHHTLLSDGARGLSDFLAALERVRHHIDLLVGAELVVASDAISPWGAEE